MSKVHSCEEWQVGRTDCCSREEWEEEKGREAEISKVRRRWQKRVSSFCPVNFSRERLPNRGKLRDWASQGSC